MGTTQRKSSRKPTAQRGGAGVGYYGAHVTPWAVIVTLLLAVPAVMMLLQVDHWRVQGFLFVVAGTVLFVAGLIYELVKRPKMTTYRIAFAVALGTALLLLWVCGAIGIIGTRHNPANLFYSLVFVMGLVGAFSARFRPHGMAITLLEMALVQFMIPVIVIVGIPTWSTWGALGMSGVLGLNSTFTALFLLSGLLFMRAERLEYSTPK